MKKRILFVMPNLKEGGAEKVLVNLANHLDKEKFDVTIRTVFRDGVNIQFIDKDVHFDGKLPKAFRGNSWLMKLFSPQLLYKWVVGDEYDIVIAYLEGPASRIVAGCPYSSTKLVAWVHVEQHDMKCAASSYRSEREAIQCYNRFNRIIAVSETVKKDFSSIFSVNVPVDVLYNTLETDKIVRESCLPLSRELIRKDEFNIISVGRINPQKSFDRLARIHIKLRTNGYPVHTYILGVGSQQSDIEKIISEGHCEDSFTFLGYDTNPYKYVKKCDLFVCSSLREGFSTAATEALIVGTPVCTVEVSGMKEMLGFNNEYGLVTENSEDALYNGIRELIDNKDLLKHYKEQAKARGKMFSTESTVLEVEKMLLSL